VIMTPLGSEVEPEVYCKKATLCGSIDITGRRFDALTVKEGDLALEMMESTLTHLCEREIERQRRVKSREQKRRTSGRAIESSVMRRCS
jgi:hypothetical protein